ILPRSSQYIKWIVSAGLAQVSEFSFVLGSRARRAGVISREVYLLILSVTTLSLLLAPVLWRAAIT
ncbi:TMCO3 isoform 9, partial [Pan troglodytes]